LPVEPLDCGNSGSTMRMLSGILAGQPFDLSFVHAENDVERRRQHAVADRGDFDIADMLRLCRHGIQISSSSC